MAVEPDPFCPVCGAPFGNVKIMDVSLLGEDEQDRKEFAYNMGLLLLSQSSVGQQSSVESARSMY